MPKIYISYSPVRLKPSEKLQPFHLECRSKPRLRDTRPVINPGTVLFFLPVFGPLEINVTARLNRRNLY